MFNQAPYPSPDQQQRARQGQSNAAAGIGGNAGQPNQRQMGGGDEGGDAVPAGIGGSAMGPFGMHHAMSHFGPDGSRVRLAIAHMAMGGAPGGMPGHPGRMLMRGQEFAAPIRNMGRPRLTRAFGAPMPIKEPGMADGGDPGGSYSSDRWGNPTNADGSTHIGGFAAGADPHATTASRQPPAPGAGPMASQPPPWSGGRITQPGGAWGGPGRGQMPMRGIGSYGRGFNPMPERGMGGPQSDSSAWFNSPLLTPQERQQQIAGGASGLGQSSHPLYGDGSGELGPPTDGGPGMNGGPGGFFFNEQGTRIPNNFGGHDANYGGPPMGRGPSFGGDTLGSGFGPTGNPDIMSRMRQRGGGLSGIPGGEPGSLYGYGGYGGIGKFGGMGGPMGGGFGTMGRSLPGNIPIPTQDGATGGGEPYQPQGAMAFARGGHADSYDTGGGEPYDPYGAMGGWDDGGGYGDDAGGWGADDPYSSYGGGIGGYQGGPGAGSGFDRYNPYPGDFYGYGEGPGWSFFGDPSQGGGAAGDGRGYGGGIGSDPYGSYGGGSYGGDNEGAGSDRGSGGSYNSKEGWGPNEVGSYAPSDYGGFSWSGARTGGQLGSFLGPMGGVIGGIAGGFFGGKQDPGITPTGSMLGTGEEVDSRSENDAAGNNGGPSGAGGPSGDGTGRDSGNQGAGAGLAADGGGTSGIGARPLDRAPVKGPGTGRSDSIPAQLSDGEHVIPADVVAGLGDGSSDAGHRILNAMIVAKRKKYRQHLGKLPPPKE